VKSWGEKSGRVFELKLGSADCLDQTTMQGRHPGEACGLNVVERKGMPVMGPTVSSRDVDIALVPVIAPANGAPRIAAIRRTNLKSPVDITLAGFGDAPNNTAAGRLRVGYTRIIEDKVVVAMATGLNGNRQEPLVPIVFKNKFYRGSNQDSWACRGDSGAPLFAGRVFGYLNESHVVAAIVSRSSFLNEARCNTGTAVDDDSQQVVTLMDPTVSRWLCDTTRRSLDICK
jgi:hypothetical protein